MINEFSLDQFYTLVSLLSDIPMSEFELLFRSNIALSGLSPDRYRQIFKVLNLVTNIQQQATESTEMAELLSGIKKLALRPTASSNDKQ